MHHVCRDDVTPLAGAEGAGTSGEGDEPSVAADPARYPLLFSGVRETLWGDARMRFVFEPEPPTPELVGNVRCACFCDDRVLVIETEEFGLSAFPGGVLEPGEDWHQALERELMEEAGARPLNYEVVGRLHFWSSLDAPYRPHLPHPEFEQVVGWADVDVVGEPTNPADGEHVLSVALVLPSRAISLMQERDPWEADLLRYVADVRGGRARDR